MHFKAPFSLEFEFKVLAFSPQFSVRDSFGHEIAYVKQKLFKLKEDITVFADSTETNINYYIKANQWIDWSASYLFTDSHFHPKGRIGRKGAKSLWKATYEIFDEMEKLEFVIQEANPYIRIIDNIMSEIPIINVFTGYMFNPSYKIVDMDGKQIGNFTKQASFMSTKFTWQNHQPLDDGSQERILLGLMMMVLLERQRG